METKNKSKVDIKEVEVVKPEEVEVEVPEVKEATKAEEVEVEDMAENKSLCDKFKAFLEGTDIEYFHSNGKNFVIDSPYIKGLTKYKNLLKK